MHPFRCSTLLLTATLLAGAPAAGQTASTAELKARLQLKLDSLHAAGRFAGATAGVVLPDGSSFGLAVGESDSVRRSAALPRRKRGKADRSQSRGKRSSRDRSIRLLRHAWKCR